MTPVDLLKQYQDLTVVFTEPSGSTKTIKGIKVTRYVSTVKNPCPQKKKENDAIITRTPSEIATCKAADPKGVANFEPTQLRLGEKDQTLPPEEMASERQTVNRVFNGKGSPEDIALTLKWAVEKGRCNPDKASIQTYCDKWLGLDCNGLTRQYFQQDKDWEPHRYLKGATQRADLIDVMMGDVVVWCDRAGKPLTDRGKRHIALVEKGSGISCSSLSGQRRLTRPQRGKKGLKKQVDHSFEISSLEIGSLSLGFNCGPRVHLVESTGGKGPVESFYPVIDEWKTSDGRQTVFRVRRPLKGGSSFVRIAKPNVPTPKSHVKSSQGCQML
jgi:hypothetical protein